MLLIETVLTQKLTKKASMVSNLSVGYKKKKLRVFTVDPADMGANRAEIEIKTYRNK